MTARRKKAAKNGGSGRPPGGKSRRFRQRTRGVLIFLALAAGAYVYDYTGPAETIWGSVERVRTYQHQSSTGSHTHTEAVIEFEGQLHTLPRADGLTQGERVLVDVSRGRLSGRPRFVSFRGTEANSQHTSEVGQELQPEPWEYDLAGNRYWHPLHGHWHDGTPPPLTER